jgi:uncharacterized repeat protein (TIGR04138 family)
MMRALVCIVGRKAIITPQLQAMSEDSIREIEDLAESDGRYKKEAYFFVYDSLQYTVEKMGRENQTREKRHISGRDLLSGISDFAIKQYGPLTLEVFAHWGVYKTRDFGEMVFNLVSAELMSKTENDCIDDFVDIYDFAQEFDWKKRRTNQRPAKNV